MSIVKVKVNEVVQVVQRVGIAFQKRKLKTVDLVIYRQSPIFSLITKNLSCTKITF